MIEASESPVRPEPIISSVKRDSTGATVSFVGSLKPFSASGARVVHGRCDGDRGQVETHLREVAGETTSKWHLDGVSICHRIGRIDIGETVLVVAVGAPHRQEAFEACQFAVDRIKEFMPLTEVLEEH